MKKLITLLILIVASISCEVVPSYYDTRPVRPTIYYSQYHPYNNLSYFSNHRNSYGMHRRGGHQQHHNSHRR